MGRAREPAPRPGPGDGAALAARLVLGIAAAAIRALSEAGAGGRPPREASAPGFAVGVAVGLGFALERRVLALAAPVLRPPLRVVSFARSRLDPWYRSGREELRRSDELAERVWRLALARIVAAVLREVDVDAIAGRVDVAAVAGRVDVDAVAERVDLDRIVDRLDIDHILQRVDLPRVTREVLEVADVDEVIRESTHSLAGESVDALRLQGMDADRAVSRVVDRLLLRSGRRRRGG